MPGTLHVVATPIGNLEDITLRALRLLREVAVIAAEDTRRSAKLLAHFGIPTRTVSYHEHNSRARLPQLLARLAAGDDVALITDAGTPAVSDPGTELVQACLTAGIHVNPVPGASAPLAAAIASGFPVVPLTVLGFVPARAKDRSAWLATIAGIPHTVSFFESPLRIQATLAELGGILVDRPICVARELTKAHQEILRGPASNASALVRIAKGEFTVVVGPSMPAPSVPSTVTDADLLAMFGHITDSGGISRRQGIAELARAHNRSAREIYAAIERAKKLV